MAEEENNKRYEEENFQDEEETFQEQSQEEEPQNEEEKSLEEQLKEKEEKIQELDSLYKRTLADFENFRKRKEEEMSAARDKAINNFVMDLLPAIDNFEMSLKMTDNKEMFIKGVEMIHKNLVDTLKEHHIEQFHPEIGEEFDPYFHEPQVVEDENQEPGKVLNVLQKGYKKGEKVVRPARVEVAAEEKQDSNQEENQQQD